MRLPFELGTVQVGDCLDLLRQMPDESVDLVITSPPYEDARLYGELGFNLKGEGWVEWAFERFIECYRVSKGLVAWVVEGKTRKFQWSATPALLMADLHRAGVRLRNPPAYFRVGIPGSGGPDWFRNDYEFVVCASTGRLPWSDNTAMGKPPKYGPGGAMSHRLKDGTRKHNPGRRPGGKTEDQTYKAPKKANPGNVVQESYTALEMSEALSGSNVVHCQVGGGHLGHKEAHSNEAPFPERLAEYFIRSCCPPKGVVLDPFCGSGTSLCVAKKWGREFLGFDLRESQMEITERRLADSCYTPEVGNE